MKLNAPLCKKCVFVWMITIVCVALSIPAYAQESSVPRETKSTGLFQVDGAKVHLDGKALSLSLDSDALKSGRIEIPRVCAPVRSVSWKGAPETPLKFLPGSKTWVFTWKKPVGGSEVIEIEFDVVPTMLDTCPSSKSAGDGSVMLHAFQASTFGEKLLFEPQWYKNTVGYWTIPTSYATWQMEIEQPGAFTVAALQGCGKGQGGSDAKITLQQSDNTVAELPFKTIDTGHFQNFRWIHLGKINITKAGKYEVKLAPIKIAKGALFDVRMIHLVRQAQTDD